MSSLGKYHPSSYANLSTEDDKLAEITQFYRDYLKDGKKRSSTAPKAPKGDMSLSSSSSSSTPANRSRQSSAASSLSSRAGSVVLHE